MVNINRGLTWDKALEFRDAVVAESTAAGETPSRNVGFFRDRIPNWGKTGELMHSLRFSYCGAPM